MKICYCLSLIMVFLAFSCKTSEKNASEELKIDQATWYNWSGGMPGVGGTNYELTITLPEKAEVKPTKLMIDSVEVTISKSEIKDKKLLVYGNENRSVRNDTVSPDDNADPKARRPEFRKTNPESAQLTVIIDEQEVILETTSFEETSSKNYQ